jgi:ABC transport system ATP-binding/permease protein
LSVLEECLTEFKGSVILVTHDRYFLDQVANQIFAFDTVNKGRIEKFANLSQWEIWHAENTREGAIRSNAGQTLPVSAGTSSPSKKGKLSFKEQREWDTIESTIQTLESEIEGLALESAKPEYATNSSELQKVVKKMSDVQAKVNLLYARWAELEAIGK